MNRNIAHALLLDAYYQVLDNRVFRLLLVLAAILILPTLLIGAREEGLVILFGVKTIPWQTFLDAFGAPGVQVPDDFNKTFIAGFQDMVVQNLAGTAGILFSIAATAFFIPRMLEKGSADVVFSRPIGRTTLLLTRYLSGVVFVALLSSALVLGMHFSLLLVSGYSDPAFLWNIPSLVYVFALVHSVSTLVAVLTRSSVAAILVSLVFFLFNGCVHRGWITLQHADARLQAASASDEAADASRSDSLLGTLRHVLGVAHHVLPKTTDADLIVGSLREKLTGRLAIVEDNGSGARWDALPPELELVGPTGMRDFVSAGPEWKWVRGGDTVAELRVHRESRLLDTSNGKQRKRSARTSAKEFLGSLPATAQGKLDPLRMGVYGGEQVTWTEDGRVRIRSWTSVDDNFLVGDLKAVADGVAAQEAANMHGRLFAMLQFERDDPRALGEQEWYRRRLSWSAPWMYNIAWSLTSSLLFAAMLLALSCWRLSRIDF